MTKNTTALKDKVLLVTGAANGLGRALALMCAKAGANLIVCDKETRGLEVLKEEILDFGLANVLTIPINFEGATIEDYELIQRRIRDEYGKINGIIFNAATLGELAPLDHYDPMVWVKVFQVNLHSIFLMLKSCGSVLELEKDCNIIFTLAPEIHKAKPFWGAYAVSKKALLGLMELTCAEMARYETVKVNGIIPSRMKTDIHRQAYPADDFSKLDTPERNASKYVDLLEGIIDYQTGEVIDLN